MFLHGSIFVLYNVIHPEYTLSISLTKHQFTYDYLVYRINIGNDTTFLYFFQVTDTLNPKSVTLNPKP